MADLARVLTDTTAACGDRPAEGQSIDVDELRGSAGEQIAGYAYPRVTWSVDELPEAPAGEILEREIPVPEGAR